MMFAFLGIPNPFGPIGWVLDEVGGFLGETVGDLASDAFGAFTRGITAWILDAVVSIATGVFNFFLDSTDPNVQADWFSGSNGTYTALVALATSLLLVCFLAGTIQGVVAGDVGGMVRGMAVHLPAAVVAMVALVGGTQVLIGATDSASAWVLADFEGDLHGVAGVLAQVHSMAGPQASAFLIVVVGLVTVVAGVILVAELVVRASLIYVVVALAPLVFATMVWPAMQGVSKKLLQLLGALIISKLVMAVALAVGAAALEGVGSGGEVTSMPAPEVVAEDPGGSVTQAIGLLLAGGAVFGVAAFSPLMVMKLMPIAEGALVAQGMRGGPMRGAQQTMAMAHHGKALAGRYGGGGGQGRSPRGGPSRPPGRGPGPATPAAGASVATAGVGVVVGATRTAARRVKTSAETQADSGGGNAERPGSGPRPPSSGPTPSSGSSRRPRRTPPPGGGGPVGGPR